MTTQTVSTIGDPTMPAENNPSGDPNKVVWMGEGNLKPPAKTLTLINNSDHTVYPFLASANNAAQSGTGSIYDPKDSWNQDYRGYIGYTGQDGKNYLGLPAGQTITVPVPLVFWDAGRIYIATDSAYLTTDAQFGQPNPPINPYQYYQSNQDGSETLRLHQQAGQLQPSKLNGVVMWYHAIVASGPRNDAPAQLLEFTIRDPWQLNLNPDLDKGSLGPLINYDVSYVDTIYLPVAMEATDAVDGSKTAAFGWIGASQTQIKFQDAFKTFTASDSSNGLGQYFGGKGYTQYNFPPDLESATGIKLPSGAQAIGDSPFQDKRSSYDPFNNQYLLSSGGTGRIEADISAVPAKEGSTILPIMLNSGPNGVEQLATLKDGLASSGTMDVTCNVSGVIPAGTKLVSYTMNKDGLTGTVTLSQATYPNPNNTSYVVNFTRPLTDYVTSALLNLWYSWAQYYIDKNQVANQTYAGSLTSDRVLTFTNPVAAKTLVPGMQVSGNGIPSGDGSFCTISTITPNDDTPIQSVTLSELVTVGASGSYQFLELQPILGINDELNGNKVVQPFPLTFTDDAATAMLFSQAVYQAMSAMSTIPKDSGNQAPLSMQILYNVLGCNVGQIPHIGQDLKVRDARIAGEITNRIKSVLRGVPDFQKYSDWYPEPSTGTGGCKFNAYNLDPFVWFVHQQLGLSGYGFSVDDDVADVGANGATNLAIAIGGLNGLPNSKQWSPENPYGT
jgi:hypothetical protein